MTEKLDDSKNTAVEGEMAGTTESGLHRIPLPLGSGDSLTCLLSSLQELSAASDLRTGLRSVADCVKRLVDYDTFGILLLDPRGRELQFEIAAGFDEDVARHWRFGMGQGIVGTAAETRRPILLPDTSQEPRYIEANKGTRSELAVPLVTKDRTVGVLDLGSSKTDFFTEEHLRLFEALSGQLATAIENARLYQNLRDQAGTLSMLHEVNRELAAILDRQQLLERVAELVRRLIKYDVFTLMLWNEESQVLEPSLAVYRDGPRVGTAESMPLGHGISGTAAALRQSIRVPNTHLDPRFVACVTDLEIRSELAVPMTVKGRLVGVLDLESAEYDTFTSQHEQTLSTLGAALAIALENARLYERLRNDERRLKRDLSTARELQKQLLPKTTPWVPGLQIATAYEPAQHLGGDFYDFQPYGDGRVALAVGDVSGKATSAALYGSLAIGMLREHTTGSQPGPAELLANMNDKLHRLGIDKRFVAMLFAVYDSTTQSLTLANSGLPHPFLLHDWRVQPIDVGGVPLGLLPDRTYDELTLELGPRDTVIITSDGIDEALNAQGEELGADRLQEILRQLAGGSANQMAAGIMDAVRRFSGSAEASDDRTIVVLKAAES